VLRTDALARMGRVRPEWTIRVGGEAAGAAEPASSAWQKADDPTLVDACLAGHREAFDVIVERHRRSVYQLCYRYVGNHEDASDLAQDAFVRAFKGLKGFKRQSALSTWLYRIAINVCLNRVSLKSPRMTSIDPVDRPDMRLERADAKLLREERAAAVRAAIAQLPRKQRATLILRIYHDLPHEQIAGILGSSVGAAKANLFHALANLKKLLT
jgi:RNA polymerase sigma-70 factor, ECF subfamily